MLLFTVFSIALMVKVITNHKKTNAHRQ